MHACTYTLYAHIYTRIYIGRGLGAGWDHDFNDVGFLDKLRTTIRYDKQIGCEYRHSTTANAANAT